MRFLIADKPSRAVWAELRLFQALSLQSGRYFGGGGRIARQKRPVLHLNYKCTFNELHWLDDRHR